MLAAAVCKSRVALHWDEWAITFIDFWWHHPSKVWFDRCNNEVLDSRHPQCNRNWQKGSTNKVRAVPNMHYNVHSTFTCAIHLDNNLTAREASKIMHPIIMESDWTIIFTNSSSFWWLSPQNPATLIWHPRMCCLMINACLELMRGQAMVQQTIFVQTPVASSITAWLWSRQGCLQHLASKLNNSVVAVVDNKNEHWKGWGHQRFFRKKMYLLCSFGWSWRKTQVNSIF